MWCVITCSGVMHVLNSRESVSPYVSIQLHSSIMRLCPKIDPHAFEIEEQISGFFGTSSKLVVGWNLFLEKVQRNLDSREKLTSLKLRD